MLGIVLYSILAMIFIAFIIAWIVVFRSYLEKKYMGRPYMRTFYLSLSLASAMLNLIIYVFSFGGVRFAALMVAGPYLIIFFCNSLIFGNFAKYYPNELKIIDKIAHITFVLPNILLPDSSKEKSWLFCHIISLNNKKIERIFLYLAFFAAIIHILVFLTRSIWCFIENKKVKVIIKEKIKEQEKLKSREENGKLYFK